MNDFKGLDCYIFIKLCWRFLRVFCSYFLSGARAKHVHPPVSGRNGVNRILKANMYYVGMSGKLIVVILLPLLSSLVKRCAESFSKDRTFTTGLPIMM